MKNETAAQQIDRLAQFIMDEIPGEPSQSEGAVDTAIRLLGPLTGPKEQRSPSSMRMPGFGAQDDPQVKY